RALRPRADLAELCRALRRHVLSFDHLAHARRGGGDSRLQSADRLSGGLFRGAAARAAAYLRAVAAALSTDGEQRRPRLWLGGDPGASRRAEYGVTRARPDRCPVGYALHDRGRRRGLDDHPAAVHGDIDLQLALVARSKLR